MSDVKHSIDPDADAIVTLADAHYKRCPSDHAPGPTCPLFIAWLELRKARGSALVVDLPT